MPGSYESYQCPEDEAHLEDRVRRLQTSVEHVEAYVQGAGGNEVSKEVAVAHKLVESILGSIRQTKRVNLKESMLFKSFDGLYYRLRRALTSVQTREHQELDVLSRNRSIIEEHTRKSARFDDSMLQQYQEQRREENRTEADHRHQTLADIETQARELVSMYREIQGLVDLQGDTLDDMSIAVEDTKARVSQGQTQVEQTKDSKDTWRRRKLWCVSIVLGVIAFFVLGEVLIRRAGSPSEH